MPWADFPDEVRGAYRSTSSLVVHDDNPLSAPVTVAGVRAQTIKIVTGKAMLAF